MNIKKIGVIGSGQMGAGIAQICSLKGFNITILDINKEALGIGLVLWQTKGHYTHLHVDLDHRVNF